MVVQFEDLVKWNRKSKTVQDWQLAKPMFCTEIHRGLQTPHWSKLVSKPAIRLSKPLITDLFIFFTKFIVLQKQSQMNNCASGHYYVYCLVLAVVSMKCNELSSNSVRNYQKSGSSSILVCSPIINKVPNTSLNTWIIRASLSSFSNIELGFRRCYDRDNISVFDILITGDRKHKFQNQQDSRHYFEHSTHSNVFAHHTDCNLNRITN